MSISRDRLPAGPKSWLKDPPPVRVEGGMLRTREGSFRDSIGLLTLLGVVIGLILTGVVHAIVR